MLIFWSLVFSGAFYFSSEATPSFIGWYIGRWGPSFTRWIMLLFVYWLKHIKGFSFPYQEILFIKKRNFLWCSWFGVESSLRWFWHLFFFGKLLWYQLLGSNGSIQTTTQAGRQKKITRISRRWFFSKNVVHKEQRIHKAEIRKNEGVTFITQLQRLYIQSNLVEPLQIRDSSLSTKKNTK